MALSINTLSSDVTRMSYEMPGQAAGAVGMGLRAASLAILMAAVGAALILTLFTINFHWFSALSATILVVVWGFAIWLAISFFRSQNVT